MATRKKRGKYYKFCIFKDDYHAVAFDDYYFYKYCIEGNCRYLYLERSCEIVDFIDKRRKPGTWCKVEDVILLAFEHYSNLLVYA